MTLTSPCPSSASARSHMPTPNASSAPREGAELTAVDGRSLPLVAATLRVRAGGGLARIVLEQTFENPYDDTLRVKYKMPLPVTGAVSGYAFRIGARTITGKVDRKESALARFEEAIATGHTAALLEQDKADIFTQQIGNVPPRASIVAEIAIDLRLAWTPEGAWELRFPTVIGPRYVAAHVPSEDARASHVELAQGGVRGRLHLELRIDDTVPAGRAPESPSHRVLVRPDGAIELAAREGEKLDRDLVVRWPVATPAIGLSVRAARPAAGSPNAHDAYALLSLVPPAADARSAVVPRDLVVLLDTSGSMSGPPLEQAKRVVASIIDSLDERDRLEILEFSYRSNAYANHPLPATALEKRRAIAWVMGRTASGGTEMHSAIVDALRGLRAGAQRQVVLVTDGYVGGEEQIATLLHESLPASCRMHVVGVGSAVNRNLAASLARAGRGAEVLVGLDEDAERSAKHLLDRTKAPVLTDVVIGGDAVIEHAPMHLPDVFAGAPLLAALQIRPTGGEIVVRGKLADGEWEQRTSVPPIEAGHGDESVTKLYARERVADLEMRWSIGRDVERIDREIESLGLVFQIATRRTSWLAIDDDRSVDPRRGSREEEIPQELPYGTTIDSFGPARAPSFESLAAMPMSLGAPASAGSGAERTRKASAGRGLPFMARRAPAPRGMAAPPPPASLPMAPRASRETMSAPPPSRDEGAPDTERTLGAITSSEASMSPEEPAARATRVTPVAPEPVTPVAPAMLVSPEEPMLPGPAMMPIDRPLAEHAEAPLDEQRPTITLAGTRRRWLLLVALLLLAIAAAAIVAWFVTR